MHIDRRLTWSTHIWTKRKQLNLKLRQMYWLLGNQSKLTIENKILIYKSILKPVWTYRIQLWGSASHSTIDILERFQSETLRQLVNAPWFVPNDIIRKDLKIPTVKEEIKTLYSKYIRRLKKHPNRLAAGINEVTPTNPRLKRFKRNRSIII